MTLPPVRLVPPLALLVGLLASSAAAQETPPPGLTGWGAANLGSTLAGPGSVPLSVLALDVQFQRHHAWLGVRGAAMFWNLEGGESAAELALFYGRATRHRGWHAAIGAGPSVIGICDAGCSTTVGLALTARASVRPTPVLGLGFQLIGNLNGESVIAGWTVFLEIGKLRG